jgi:DNA integrity scanning protein DisA with diadenylate cyclase activity
VLSPNQEIKLFAEGRQAFAFTHGRWRILDPDRKYALWSEAVAHAPLARVLYQAALEMAEERHGGLFVVVRNPPTAMGSLIAPHDLLNGGADSADSAPTEQTLHELHPLARRALHYLARGRNVITLDPTVLEAMAGLDGALVCDPMGHLIAFGAILRHQVQADLPGLVRAEGARTAAALVASRHGPVLKVSEDGIVSCFLDGARVWDL